MELVIFIGVQASGKTTFFQEYFAQTHTLVSKDCFRNNKNRQRRQSQLIQAALQAGKSVVVDNTNPTIESRGSIIEIAQSYDSQIIGYYFQSQIAQCLQRNQQRLGKARVPDIAIYATSKKLIPPTYTEGFHQIFYVKITDNFTFQVSPYTAVP